MKQLRILLSAYACEPWKGSEPGVGWNVARAVAAEHEVWVLTRANNRLAIEAALAQNPQPQLHFAYYDLPPRLRGWKHGQRGVHLYYLLWQAGAAAVARELHARVGFDVAHHVTFVNYYWPTAVDGLGMPFLWGPVGGGESAPRGFWPGLGARGAAYEVTRELNRWLAERNPQVRAAARHAGLALATTPETAGRLRRLGAREVRVFSQVGLPGDEIDALGSLPQPPERPFRFLSLGRLLALKGFHLGLEAFARSGLKEAEYWIVGDGPERKRLERLAERLGVAGRVRFWGWLAREQALQALGQCHVLVHPSLHDSGGWVCLEAMAAGRPVLCLGLGGPAMQVDANTGFQIVPREPEKVVIDLGTSMFRLAYEPKMRIDMGYQGKEKVKRKFDWAKKGLEIIEFYKSLIE